MFNLEKAIKQWKSNLRKNPSFEDGDIAELEAHLRDRIHQLKAGGQNDEKAFLKASGELGEPEKIGEELFKTKTMKIEATPSWKQKSWIPFLLPNYIKVALRNLSKDPVNSLINVFGLTVGLICTIVIFLFVRYEMSYDGFHENSDQIYRLVYDENYQGETYKWANSWSEWAGRLEEQLPEIKESTRLLRSQVSVKHGEDVFRETRMFYADPEFFNVFNTEFIKGNPETALKNPDGIVLTEETAKKYFGDTDPLGQELLLNREDLMEVKGVIKSWPENSHLKFDLLLSLNFMYKGDPQYSTPWAYTYLVLDEGASVSKFDEELRKQEHWFVPRPDFGEVEAALQPLKDIHLHSHRRNELGVNGDILYVYIFSFVAILILVITCLNYINLTSAGSFKRFKEIGMRKTLGAKKNQLIGQFLGESLLIVFLALFLAVLLTEPATQFYNYYLQTDLDTGPLWSADFLIIVLALTILTGLLAGIYPAFYLSNLNPLSTLKGSSEAFQSKLWIRDGGVVLQFVISTILLVCAFVVKDQVAYIQNKETGFSQDQIVTIPISDTPLQENFDLFKENVLKHAGISGVTASSTKPGVQDIWVGTFQPEGLGSNQQNWIVPHLLIEHDFLNTYDIELIKGRGFSKDYPSDADNAFILNESAVKSLGWEEPLGKRLQTWGDKVGQVIGVVQDFNFENLRQPVQPLVLHISSNHYGYASIKIGTENASQVLKDIEKEWHKLAPSLPFEYGFLDAEYQQVYQAEVRMGRLTTVFTVFALFFACLGLWGLTAFKVKAKRKEIGIRKVLGASVSNIVLLIGKDFTLRVLIAVAIAIPFSWYLMNSWLNEYAYRTDLEWWMFAISGIATLIITLMAVSGLLVRAALTNPVKGLRNE